MQRMNLADFELTAVSDGLYRLDGGAFFGIIPKSMWSKKVQADENNLVPVGLNSIVVQTGKQTVLIETGIGNKLSEKMQKIYGQPAKLLENLSAAGVSPEEIDIVINSHLHFDHCGWNTIYSPCRRSKAKRSTTRRRFRRSGSRCLRTIRRYRGVMWRRMSRGRWRRGRSNRTQKGLRPFSPRCHAHSSPPPPGL